jgi:bifunctional non-homologous end joining protein LigD
MSRRHGRARRVEVSRPDKPLWPGTTKLGYDEYLTTVSGRMLTWLRGRPLTLVRAPDGVEAHRYFQKAAPSHAPSWIRTVEIPAPSAHRNVDYVLCDDLPTLRWLGNQATVEFHVGPVRRDRVDRPDLLVVDIDPPQGRFEAAVEAALLVVEVLDDLGMPTGVKTTGGKGLHVVVPIERRVHPGELRAAAARLTALVAERRPELITDEFRKADRGERVMLDPSRNGGSGATIVAPYSPRARPGATVSFPVLVEELNSISPGDFTLATVPGWLDRPGPRRWEELATQRRRLPSSLLT